jgi:type VI secretion system protein ImpH
MSDRTADASLRERLLRESDRFSFFQLVRLLLREQEGAVAPGGDGPAAREAIRFRPAAHLGFAASDVQGVEVKEVPGAEIPTRFTVAVNFMGLYGPSSPMPNHFTEEILWAGVDGEGVRDFIDLFQHRLISFFYRSWEKYRYPIEFEAIGPDAVSRRFLCLAGLGTSGMAEAAGVPVVRLLRTAGLLATRHRSAAALEGLLRDHLAGVSITIESCVERDARIPAAQRIRLGQSASRLGDDACLGERLRDRAGSFRVAIGPMDGDAFRRFLPGGEDLERLVRLVRLFVTDPLDFDVALLLAPASVPPLRLAPQEGLGLGRMSWLAPREPREGRVVLSTRALDPLAPAATASAAAPRPAATTAGAAAARPSSGMTTTTRRP